MKESTLLEMQNKIKAITNVLQQLINENTLKHVAVSMFFPQLMLSPRGHVPI